jgi:hypothetical protein
MRGTALHPSFGQVQRALLGRRPAKMTKSEAQPPVPAKRPPPGPGRRAFQLISSPRLAIALLIAVLACCVIGVTVFTPEPAWRLIFNTIWFNGLLSLLAMSSGLTFFGRIWGRKLTLVSVGMILFHLSFMAMLGGVVFNSLVHFHGVLRLTEGETLPNGDPTSYDSAEVGRFFDFSRLHGETTLLAMHRDYKVGGQNKRVAYEIAVGDGASRTTGTIYMTQNLDHDGVRYLVSKEGHSLGVVLHDRVGKELYAAMIPLQSLPRGKDSYLYTTGSSQAPGSFPFPPPPAPALFLLQAGYVPDQQADRAGQVEFFTWPAEHRGASSGKPPSASGKVVVGGSFDAGDYQLEAREVRYWVGMSVRRDPGLPVILTSLWTGLAGMTMTFVGRILQDARRGRRGAPGELSNHGASKENP